MFIPWSISGAERYQDLLERVLDREGIEWWERAGFPTWLRMLDPNHALRKLSRGFSYSVGVAVAGEDEAHKAVVFVEEEVVFAQD